MQTETVAAFEQRAALGLQALVIERGEPVKAVDDMAVIEEAAAEVKADEAGAPVTKICIGQCRSLRLRDGEAYSIGGPAATRFAQAGALWIRQAALRCARSCRPSRISSIILR